MDLPESDKIQDIKVDSLYEISEFNHPFNFRFNQGENLAIIQFEPVIEKFCGTSVVVALLVKIIKDGIETYVLSKKKSPRRFMSPKQAVAFLAREKEAGNPLLGGLNA